MRPPVGPTSGFSLSWTVFWIVLVCLLLNLSAPAQAPNETQKDETQKRVLVFYATRKESPGSVISERVYQKTLSDGLAGRLDYYGEYIDVGRFPELDYQSALRDFLRRKYERQHMDLIIATSNTAVEFIARYGAELFPKTPVVFIGGDKSRPSPNSTGMSHKLDFSGTLDVALKLQPGARQVFVVSGASDFDKYYEAVARRQFQEFEGRVAFTWLTGLTFEDLQKRVAKLPADSIIYYLALTEDSAGNRFLPLDPIDKISAAANVPIYGWFELFTDHGIVGGRLLSQEIVAQKTAELALRVLRGERPESIPVTEIDAGVNQFDWRQLQRWGISETRLPPGSVILHEQPSVWDRYKGRIIGGIALIIVQTLLIVALLVNRAMRRRAQQSLAERLRFESLLAELSAAFVSLPADGVDREVEKWLQRLVEFLDVDRISLVEYSPDGTMLGTAHSHTRSGVGPGSDLVLISQSPWYAEQLRSGKPLAFSRLPDDLPEEAKLEREYCLTTGLKSNVIIPLPVGGARNCALALSSSQSYRDWPDELVARLQLIGEVFANALIRQQGEQWLHDAFAQIKDLKDQLQAENVYLQEEIKLSHNFEEIIGESDALKYVLYKVEQVAVADTTVLILGETGTGKELIARAIHHASPRKNRTLVKVNCAALPANLIESELFGHEKGAFTGASARQLGRFELANGGTLFLDEIGEMPLELQPKLLRVLQEGEFERLGGSQTVKVDVRVIAATNRNLKQEVQNRTFREDLWYRLNVFPVTLPPLRQRKGDIPLLVNFFANQFGRKLGRSIKSVEPATMKALQSHSWPGNIRELANVIERAVINTPGPVLRLADQLEAAQNSQPGNGKSLSEMEREMIIRRLDETNWKIEGSDGAAQSLGLKPSTLRLRMGKLNIKRSKLGS